MTSTADDHHIGMSVPWFPRVYKQLSLKEIVLQLTYTDHKIHATRSIRHDHLNSPFGRPEAGWTLNGHACYRRIAGVHYLSLWKSVVSYHALQMTYNVCLPN